MSEQYMSETVGVPTDEDPLGPEPKTDEEKQAVRDKGRALVERDQKVRKAYAEATKELRELNHDQFVELQKKHAKELGVDWQPRLTEEQRAKKAYKELLEKYPHFAE